MTIETKQNIWANYLKYLNQWVDEHTEGEFYGMSPACFDEWKENEFTYPLSNELFNEISDLCDRLKIDWFYNEYRESDTIKIEDVWCLYDAWIVDKSKITTNILGMFIDCGLEGDE